MSDSSLFFSEELGDQLQEFLEERIQQPQAEVIFSAFSTSGSVALEHQVHAVTFSGSPLVELSMDIESALDIAANARDLELENLKIIYYGKETAINGYFSVVTARLTGLDAATRMCILQLLLEKKSGTVI